MTEEQIKKKDSFLCEVKRSYNENRIVINQLKQELDLLKLDVTILKQKNEANEFKVTKLESKLDGYKTFISDIAPNTIYHECSECNGVYSGSNMCKMEICVLCCCCDTCNK
jgi:hypothetical protein